MSGILATLDATVGQVPRVLLRDGSTETAKLVRPHSNEMPKRTGEAGRYHLLGEIARGGMGVVLQGRDEDLGRDLAVKVLLEKHRDNAELVRRFIEEAQIGGQLQHPGIVPVYELGQLPDRRLYIAMKLVKGRTLAALLEARRDPMEDRARLLHVFEQVCQTMAYAHSCGVIHRDLKPSNVMVGSFGEVQVMDWGLAKVLCQGGVADDEKPLRECVLPASIRTMRTGSEAGESRAGSVLGTPAYMAPEQARGSLDTVDERADVFGLGAILCELLTGQPVYLGATGSELYRMAERADLADAFSRLEKCGADPDVVALARWCLAAAPRDRPRDAGAVVANLSGYLTGVQERLRAAEMAQARAEAHATEERKRWYLTVGLTASVVMIASLAAGGWSWMASEHAARAAARARAVNLAFDDAAQKLDKARYARGNPTRWVEAVEAAKHANALLSSPTGEIPGEIRSRVLALLATAERERTRAEATMKDRRMVERLAEIHNDLGVHLDQDKANADYSAAFRDYGVDIELLAPAVAGRRIADSAVAVELANALDQWTFMLRNPFKHDLAAAARVAEIAKTADPDPWRNRLRNTLEAMFKDRRGTVALLNRLAATADPDVLPEASVTRLAFALASSGSRKTAINLLRRTQRAHPDDFWVNMDLGRELMITGEHEEAGRFFSVAVAIRTRSGLAHRSLGSSLEKYGRLEEAAATLQQGIRSRADDSHTHEALGRLLIDMGRVDQAIGSLRTATELDPNFAAAQFNLGRALFASGDFAAAIHHFQRSRSGTIWGQPRSSSTDFIHEAERMISLEPRLTELQKASVKLDPDESAALARLCRIKQLHATSARLWAEAFTASPKLTGELYLGHRFAAACSAALAASEQSKDEPRTDQPTRDKLRRAAIDWLEADLAQSTALVERGSYLDRMIIPTLLSHWRVVPDLASLRDPAALAALPDQERHDCTVFWSRVDLLIDTGRRSPPPEPAPDAD
jgi:eukaryotic-like serine/threonine-protein kinase